MTKDNQDITKIYELIQQENRWNRIVNFAQTALVLVPSLALLWKSFKPKPLSPKKRLMRIEAAMARLQLEREHVRQEAVHEAELKKMETGLEAEESQDLLSSLKQKGQSLLKDKIDQVNKVVDDKLKSAKETVSSKLKIDQLTSLTNKDKKDKE